jgi:hypothetical protein
MNIYELTQRTADMYGEVMGVIEPYWQAITRTTDTLKDGEDFDTMSFDADNVIFQVEVLDGCQCHGAWVTAEFTIPIVDLQLTPGQFEDKRKVEAEARKAKAAHEASEAIRISLEAAEKREREKLVELKAKYEKKPDAPRSDYM